METLISTGVNAAIGGIAGGSVNPHLSAMDKALIKRISNAITNRMGKGATKEILNAIEYYLSQTVTLITKSAIAGFREGLPEETISELLENAINAFVISAESGE